MVNVFLPMRAGSERIPRKNTKPFANIEGGLCKIKLEQLVKCNFVERIIVSTDDPEVKKISKCINSKKIDLLSRPVELAVSSTSTEALIEHAADIMPNEHIMWTHVTSPFIDSNIYDWIIETYFNNLQRFDSLMTVTKVQKYIWNDAGALNYDISVEKWPRTQTLSPLWEINSGAFITSREIYQGKKDRIGYTPYLFQLENEIGFDIDWPSDFKTAEKIYSAVVEKK